MLGGSKQRSILMEQLDKRFKRRFEKISEINKQEREKVNSNKNSMIMTVASTAGAGVAVAAVAISVMVTGPFGLFAVWAALGSATAGGAASAGIGAGITALLPRGWFGTKNAAKDKVKESRDNFIDN